MELCTALPKPPPSELGFDYRVFFYNAFSDEPKQDKPGQTFNQEKQESGDAYGLKPLHGGDKSSKRLMGQ